MGITCVAVAGWLWSLKIDWEAWSAIGTVMAAGVALFLPQHAAKKEWARQDGIRIAELARIEKAESDVVREVCSTVDQILAYKKSATALFEADNVYSVGFAAIERIHENTKTLLEMLEVLKGRSELTDGALYVAVSGKRLVEAVIAQTVAPDVVTGPNWIARSQALKTWDPLSAMIEKRNSSVRKYAKLNEKSSRAEMILQKYEALAEAIKTSRKADNGQPDIKITEEYY